VDSHTGPRSRFIPYRASRCDRAVFVCKWVLGLQPFDHLPICGVTPLSFLSALRRLHDRLSEHRRYRRPITHRITVYPDIIELWKSCRPYHLLTERCSWLLIFPNCLDSIMDLAPRDSVAVHNFPILMETAKISALIRSFRDPLIPGNTRWPFFLLFVDFQDYAIAASLLNGVFVDDVNRGICSPLVLQNEVGGDKVAAQ
jgi:hypothetical protein